MTVESSFHFIGLRLLLLIFGAKVKVISLTTDLFGTQQTNGNPSNSSCGFLAPLGLIG